jgi:hypothetical protein
MPRGRPRKYPLELLAQQPEAQPPAAASSVTVPVPAVVPPPYISISVPWETLDLLEAQHYYSELKKEFERAGAILNARCCEEGEEKYVCFMAGKPGACELGMVRTGRPRGIDYAHKDPHSGLLKPAKICSERCWILYQQQLINERRERELAHY